MNNENTKNKINELIQLGEQLISKIKESQLVIAEDISGGMKDLIYSKFNEIESNANHLMSILTETKDFINSKSKKIKNIKKPNVASDVWSLLK